MIKKKDKYIPMDKSTFIKIINEIKEYHEKIDKIQNILNETSPDFIFFPPSLEDTLIKALVKAFNDTTEIIPYFIYELNFGADWYKGYIIEDDKDIKMSTTEDLYNYLIERL